ncbi:MAG TPA: hypothetical protein DD490_07510 [Acidobacteria bacterium]|nr:hypothetical protein [Acidobacteriota bacterium]
MIQIGSGRAGGLTVRVLASPAGEGEAPFRLPAASAEWLRTRADLCRGRHLSVDQGAPGTPAPRQVGEALFRTLFAGQVGLLFAESRGTLSPQGEGLRLRLRFRLDPADPRLTLLHGLPWELLCEPETRDFLALSRRTPVVRSLDVPRAVPPLPPPSELRLLVAMADAPGHPLDLQRERRLLEKAWAGVPGIEILDLARTGIAALRETLLAAPVHVLHLMGHGEIDPATQAGTLVFTGPEGSPLAVTGETLAHLLKDFPALRLVFLNACDTGRVAAGPETDPFSGVATALVLGGIPAVVAMQLPVADTAAIAFSRTVYERLALGDPLDAAVTEGRQAIHALYPDTAEWAIPILFTRIADGRIFAPGSATPPPAAPPEAAAARLPRPLRRPWLPFPRARWLAAEAFLLALAVLLLFVHKTPDPPLQIERVWLGSFWIARYEVSNRELLRFVEQNPQWRRDRIPREFQDGDYLLHWTSPIAYSSGISDHPATHVSWHAAQAFCRWAGGELPTRDEWQRAAHAADTAYPWGPADLSGPARMNFCDVACRGDQRSVNPRTPELNDLHPGTAPVTAFPGGRTREGVFNLSGNVWEWCLDASSTERVTMGGSYSATFEECTTTEPSWEPPNLCAADGGFRCVWHLK